eukprot:SAG11_NODE_27591_length_331_cov_0.663793_1_plen_81_part_01
MYSGRLSNAEQGQMASTRVFLETPNSTWQDTQVSQDLYRDNEQMRGLIARDVSSVYAWREPPPNHPHCYELTTFIAMFDQY